MYRVDFKSIDINTRSLENSDAIYSRGLLAHISFSEIISKIFSSEETLINLARVRNQNI